MKQKLILSIIAVVLLQAVASAQGLDAWFSQQSLQDKYQLQQIAALKTYFSSAKKGYEIVSSGLHTIRNIKSGDLSIHQTFLTALKKVNPKIAGYTKVADIIHYQLRIIRRSNQMMQHVRQSKQFSSEEAAYCKKVLDALLKDCYNSIGELTSVLTPGHYAMNDQERLKQIDKLYVDVQDKYSFCSQMSADVALLAIQRIGEQAEINKSKLINGGK